MINECFGIEFGRISGIILGYFNSDVQEGSRVSTQADEMMAPIASLGFGLILSLFALGLQIRQSKKHRTS